MANIKYNTIWNNDNINGNNNENIILNIIINEILDQWHIMKANGNIINEII